jgi:hypothetical protein
MIYGYPHKHILDFGKYSGYSMHITDLMKRVSQSQIDPTGGELIFRRRWTCGQADFCPATPDEQADFLLGGALTKRLFLFAACGGCFSASYLMGR